MGDFCLVSPLLTHPHTQLWPLQRRGEDEERKWPVVSQSGIRALWLARFPCRLCHGLFCGLVGNPVQLGLCSTFPSSWVSAR